MLNVKKTLTKILKSESITLTFNGCTNEDSICTRSGGVVSLTFIASGASVTTSWTKVGNVLSSFPSAIITGVGMANYTAIQFRVTSAGEINIRGGSSLSSQTIRCNLTWTI